MFSYYSERKSVNKIEFIQFFVNYLITSKVPRKLFSALIFYHEETVKTNYISTVWKTCTSAMGFYSKNRSFILSFTVQIHFAGLNFKKYWIYKYTSNYFSAVVSLQSMPAMLRFYVEMFDTMHKQRLQAATEIIKIWVFYSIRFATH